MRIGIIYWSGTGNTEAMATLVAEGARIAGADVEILPVSQCDLSVLDRYDRLAFGCPASSQEELEDLEFLPFFETIESHLAGREVALFGSYDWGDGQWMRDWQERVSADGAHLFEDGLTVQGDPGAESESCRQFGYRFAIQ